MKRVRLILLLAVPLLTLTVFTLAWSVLHSTAGARWLLSTVADYIPGRLESSQLRGDLSSGLTIKDLNYQAPGLELGTGQLDIAINLDFFPLVLRVTRLHVQTLRVNQLNQDPETDSANGASIEDILTSMALPIRIELEDLMVEPVHVSGPDKKNVFTSDRVGARLGIGDVLRIDRLFSESGQARIELSGDLALAAPFPVQARLNGELTIAQKDSPVPWRPAFQLDIDGEITKQVQLLLDVKNPAITLTGSVQNLADDARWQMLVKSPLLHWPLPESGDPDFAVLDFELNSQGWINQFQLSSKGILQSRDLKDLEFSSLATGDSAGLNIKELLIGGEQLELSASGDLNWQDEMKAGLSVKLARLEPQSWVSDWPEPHPLNGSMEFILRDDGLELPDIQLEVANTSMRLDGNGRVELPGGAVAADLNWKNLAWPVGSDAPEITSTTGMVHLSGVIDDWTMTGETDIGASGLPEGRLKLEASGNRDRAQLTIIDGKVLQGELSGQATYDWSNDGQWSAELKSTDINTSPILPDWPATLNANVVAQGSVTPFSLLLDIRRLDGEFKNLPLNARGGVQVKDKEPYFNNFVFNLGESNITLNGQPSTPEGVEFSTQIDNFSSLIPGSAGSLQATGRLSILAEKPRLQLDLDGQQLAWEDLSLQSISIHNAPNRPADALAALQLEMAQLEMGTESVESVRLDLLAGPEIHSADLEAQGMGMNVSAALTGGFQTAGKPMLESTWAGQITSLNLSDGQDLNLALQNPATLELSADSAALDNACLGSGADDSLCLSTEWRQSRRFSAKLASSRFPLRLLQSVLETELNFTQTIGGEMDWLWSANQGNSASASFSFSPGEIRSVDEYAPVLETGEAQLSLLLEGNELSSGQFTLPFPGVGETHVNLSIADITAGLATDMDGQLHVAIRDLYLLSLLVPEFDQTGGRLSADLDLSGSLGKPIVNGILRLEDGLIRHQASGLALSEIQLSGQVINNDNTAIEGSFRAVEGTGELEARLDLADIVSPRIEIGLRGEKLKLFDSPELSLVTDSDIQLILQEGLIEIGGKILIPSARLAPRHIPSAVVSESPDLVITAGLPEETEEPAEPENETQIRGKLEVALGDEVVLDLGLAQAELSGSVLFEWKDDPIPIANGQYRLVGQINAFGQRLDINQGNIGFPSVPANNPHLNIRAERQIFGNSEIRHAGVFVSGTLNRLSVEPYTQPATDRERARTLLITGSDFNMDQGVGAVDIGTYIAPRVYVSYGFGVFDNDHIVSVRYDLGRGWGVKATSGQRQTGLDLTYTIER